MVEEPGRLDDEELQALARLIAEAEACRTLASGASAAGPDRIEQIEREFADRMGDPIRAFMDVAEKHSRLGLVRLLVKSFRQTLRERRARTEVVVTTARPIDPDRQEELRAQLAELLKVEPVLVTRVDEALVGGMTVQMADRIYDASVAGNLRRLKRKLMKEVGRNAS